MDEDDIKWLCKDSYTACENECKQLKLRCARSFILVLVCDMVSSFDNYAYTHDWFYTQMVSGAISQLGWLTASFLFFNAKNNRERVFIGLSECAAASIGSTLMLGWVKPWYLEILKGIVY